MSLKHQVHPVLDLPQPDAGLVGHVSFLQVRREASPLCDSAKTIHVIESFSSTSPTPRRT